MASNCSRALVADETAPGEAIKIGREFTRPVCPNGLIALENALCECPNAVESDKLRDISPEGGACDRDEAKGGVCDTLTENGAKRPFGSCANNAGWISKLSTSGRKAGSTSVVVNIIA
jgi:hypothetical protein